MRAREAPRGTRRLAADFRRGRRGTPTHTHPSDRRHAAARPPRPHRPLARPRSPCAPPPARRPAPPFGVRCQRECNRSESRVANSACRLAAPGKEGGGARRGKAVMAKDADSDKGRPARTARAKVSTARHMRRARGGALGSIADSDLRQTRIDGASGRLGSLSFQ